MNLKYSSFCRSIALFLFCIPLAIQAQSPIAIDSTAALVNRLTSQFAVPSQLKEQPRSIRNQFEQNPLSLPEKTNSRILGQFSEAYDTQALVADFKAALQNNIPAEFTDDIARKTASLSIRAVTEAQQEYYTLQGKRKRIITRYEMDQQPPSAKRRSAISALVDTTAIADGSVESSVLILRSLLKALIQSNDQLPYSESRLNAITKNFQAQMQSQASQQANRQLMVTYHPVDLNNLKQYVAFMQSPAGQALDKAITQSMRSAYEAAANRFSQAVQSD